MTTALAIITIALSLGLVGLLLVVIKLVRNLDTTLSLDPNITLQQVLKSLQLAAKLAAKVAKDLEVNLAESRQQFSRLVVLLDRMQMDVTATGESGVRIEADRAHVAEDLATLQRQARDSEQGTPPGTIADAAAAGIDEAVPRRGRQSKKAASSAKRTA